MKKLILTTAIALCFLPSHSKAQGIPVYDNASVLQAIAQIEQMARDYELQLRQIDQALANYNAITGGRDIGTLHNSSAEQDLRRALPPDLQELIGLNNATNLGAAGLETQGIYNDILTTYQPATGADLIPSDPNGSLAGAYDRHSNTTYAAMAASETAYNNAADRLAGYEEMLQKLNTTTDLKESVDLLARITAENGILLNELMQMQSLQMQLNSTRQGSDLTTLQRANKAYNYDPAIAAETFD